MPSLNLNLTDGNISTVERPKIFTSGLVVVSAMLLLALGAYWALLYMKNNVDAKIEATRAEYDTEYAKFKKGNANEIIDFGNRSAVATKLLADERSMGDIFGQLESSILPAVYIDSLTYNKSKGTISLICVADNFNTVARQILSFKENKYFLTVTPADSSIESESKKLKSKINLILLPLAPPAPADK